VKRKKLKTAKDGSKETKKKFTFLLPLLSKCDK
jgi:hypothetical protein